MTIFGKVALNSKEPGSKAPFLAIRYSCTQFHQLKPKVNEIGCKSDELCYEVLEDNNNVQAECDDAQSPDVALTGDQSILIEQLWCGKLDIQALVWFRLGCCGSLNRRTEVDQFQIPRSLASEHHIVRLYVQMNDSRRRSIW